MLGIYLGWMLEYGASQSELLGYNLSSVLSVRSDCEVLWITPTYRLG